MVETCQKNTCSSWQEDNLEGFLLDKAEKNDQTNK